MSWRGRFREESAGCDFDIEDFDEADFDVRGFGWQCKFTKGGWTGRFRVK